MPDQVFSVEAFIGPEFSHYRTNEEIGSGEMGVFFRAHDQHLDREVAIKVLSSGTLTDEITRKHFHKETLALCKLSQPGVATVHDLDMQRGGFLVMECIPGMTHNQKLSDGPLPGWRSTRDEETRVQPGRSLRAYSARGPRQILGRRVFCKGGCPRNHNLNTDRSSHSQI